MDRLPLLWPLPSPGALHNAREAMATLAGAVSDRLALTASLDSADHDEPGGLRALTIDECYQLLAEGAMGRLAYIARAGVPDIVPVNYALDDGDILIRSGPGPKLQAAERRDQIAFEVDAVDDGLHTGRSVVVIGRARRLHASEQRHLAAAPGPWVSGPRHAVIRIRPTRVTGRRLS